MLITAAAITTSTIRTTATTLFQAGCSLAAAFAASLSMRASMPAICPCRSRPSSAREAAIASSTLVRMVASD